MYLGTYFRGGDQSGASFWNAVLEKYLSEAFQLFRKNKRMHKMPQIGIVFAAINHLSWPYLANIYMYAHRYICIYVDI